jgi:alpha-galactosidase
MGIELFVLDDGWFTNRNNDTTGLGDWNIDFHKLTTGLKGFSQKVNDRGLKFGLWIEPEMINKGTQLFENHPEWVIQTPKRKLNHGRNQFVLDLSNQDVIDYLYEKLSHILKDASISYIKWDMNRSISDAYSLTHNAYDQGKIMHQYILGVYQLYERLTQAFPSILFESCASGGARFDPGMMYYAPQCWTSDNTDAIERLKIQYGTSYVYPLSSMGSHVSAIPNHQVYRNTSMETRANVAYFGTFGYELDLTLLTDEDKNMIKQQVQFMKKYRNIIQFGTFYRLKSPFNGNETIWMVVSKDQDTAIVGYYRTLQEVNVGYRRVKLLGLDENKKYHVSVLDEDCYGDELMNIGLLTTDASSGENRTGEGDYVSRIYILNAK